MLKPIRQAQGPEYIEGQVQHDTKTIRIEKTRLVFVFGSILGTKPDDLLEAGMGQYLFDDTARTQSQMIVWYRLFLLYPRSCEPFLTLCMLGNEQENSENLFADRILVLTRSK